MNGSLRGPWFEQAIASMLRSNAEAAEVARRHGATAATDVTGFGLAGHLAGMLRAAEVAADVSVERLPALAGAIELLRAGFRSTFHQENARLARTMSIEPAARDDSRFPLLFDPQTAVPPKNAEAAIEELVESGHVAAVIGSTTEAHGGPQLRVTS